MRDIKKEYKKYVTTYFLLYILICLIIITKNDINIVKIRNLFENDFMVKSLITVVAAPLISIISLMIFNIVPSHIKEILTHWKLKNILPSFRWKDLCVNDNRVDIIELEKKYGNDLSEAEQNRIWYRAYQKHQNDDRILNSQRDYLFARDFCISNVILVPIIFTMYVLGKIYYDISINFILYNFIVIVMLYLFSMIVTRNNAKRFVCNVLALDSVS